MAEFEIGDEKYYPNEPSNCSHDDIDDGTCKLCGISVGDRGEIIDEVNTSYDQEQPIGDSPQALYTEPSNSEPIDAKTGQDFYDIQIGGQAPRIGEFRTVWKELGYEVHVCETDEFGHCECNSCGVENSSCKNCKKMKSYKTGEESLNKDGTGVQHATRGVNPNDPKYDLLKFNYVSKSDCPICKQYDGKVYHKDDPDRPIIPRLESGYSAGKGYAGSNYTHPHCKCKWTYVFNKTGEVKDSTLARARKWYGVDFDDLTSIEQKIVVIDMFKDSLRGESSAEEFDLIDPVPFASMAKLAFDAIKPTIINKLKIGEAQAFLGQPHAKPHAYEIQGMLNDIVGKSLGKDEKEEIEEAVNNDFTLNNLLNLVAEKLAGKLGKRLGVESMANEDYSQAEKDMGYGDSDDWRDKIPAGTPYCENCGRPLMNGKKCKNCGFANEGGRGSGKYGHQKWMLGAEGIQCEYCMMITERENDICTLCGL